MKRKIVTGVLVVIAFLLQSTLFGKLTFANIRPNLLIILTASIGFMRGRKEGMAVGFACGILMDVFWGNILGFYALIYTVLGYANGTFQRMFYDDDFKLPIVMIGISDLLYSLTVFVCLFLLRSEFIFSYFLNHVMLPELIYTILITLFLYQLLLYINRKLETEEQRSASRFV